jgi:hypothetical protein
VCDFASLFFALSLSRLLSWPDLSGSLPSHCNLHIISHSVSQASNIEKTWWPRFAQTRRSASGCLRAVEVVVVASFVCSCVTFIAHARLCRCQWRCATCCCGDGHFALLATRRLDGARRRVSGQQSQATLSNHRQRRLGYNLSVSLPPFLSRPVCLCSALCPSVRLVRRPSPSVAHLS